MIIEFPTALYSPLLPKEASDNQSVTFIISSEDPPRDTSITRQLFRGEELRPLPPKIYTYNQRRSTYGDYIFNVSSGANTLVGDGQKGYEVGQVLEFGDEDVPELSFPEIPAVLELQQNTNRLNLEAAGLTEEEASELIQKSQDQLNELIKDYNEIQSDIKDNETKISDSNKQLSEVRKIKNAASAVIGATGSEIYEKLVQREEELVAERDRLIEYGNDLNELAKDVYDEILVVREMVR